MNATNSLEFVENNTVRLKGRDGLHATRKLSRPTFLMRSRGLSISQLPEIPTQSSSTWPGSFVYPMASPMSCADGILAFGIVKQTDPKGFDWPLGSARRRSESQSNMTLKSARPSQTGWVGNEPKVRSPDNIRSGTVTDDVD